MAFRFNVGVAGSHMGREPDRTEDLGPQRVLFSARPFAGVDAIFYDRAVVGLEGEAAFGQDVSKAGPRGKSRESETTVSEYGRLSGRIGYDFGGIIPYVRAGVSFDEVAFHIEDRARRGSFREGGTFPAYSRTITRPVAAPFLGVGIEARYIAHFARIEGNWFGLDMEQPDFRLVSRSLSDTRTISYEPAILDYEIRAALGVSF